MEVKSGPNSIQAYFVESISVQVLSDRRNSFLNAMLKTIKNRLVIILGMLIRMLYSTDL